MNSQNNFKIHIKSSAIQFTLLIFNLKQFTLTGKPICICLVFNLKRKNEGNIYNPHNFFPSNFFLLLNFLSSPYLNEINVLTKFHIFKHVQEF